MRIAITVPSLSSLDIHAGGNVQGDEMIARAWYRYLLADDIWCQLFTSDSGPLTGFDAAVHFSLFNEVWPFAKNYLYLQNAFPPDSWPGGTVGMLQTVHHRYDGFIFTSQKLAENCAAIIGDRPSVVIPFAVDPQLYQMSPPCPDFVHQVAFVGNNIRGSQIVAKYLKPAISHGLVIYGNRDGWGDPYHRVCRGKISVTDEAKLYSSASICLNCHIDEHVTHDTINYRVYCILACGGFIISEPTPSMESVFGEAVVFSSGDDDLQNKITQYLLDPPETKKYREAGRDLVLSGHTFKHRMEILQSFLMG